MPPSAMFATAAHSGSSDPATIFDACEEERIRLCRALHDSTGQLLLSLSLSFAQFRDAAHDPRLEPILKEMGDTISDISQEIRNFSFMEYPAELNAAGLSAALNSFVKEMVRRTGLQIHFRCRTEHEQIGSQVALALLRIAQEAVVNVHRHAKATKVQLVLTKRGNAIELTVRDNGCGIPPAADIDDHHGIGLAGMRDRAERLGGSLLVGRVKPGTKVIASIPVKAGEAVERRPRQLHDATVYA